MRCPFCGNEDTQVKDSRPAEEGGAIRRRRQCPACGARFTTFERVQLRDLVVVKKDGRRVAFDREKLARSLRIATRKRGIDEERTQQLVNIAWRMAEVPPARCVIWSVLLHAPSEELAYGQTEPRSA